MFSLVVFSKHSIYKQLHPASQIDKQLSGLNPLSRSKTIKTADSRRVKFFLCNKRKIAVKPTIHQNSHVSKELLGKSLIINIDFES